MVHGSRKQRVLVVDDDRDTNEIMTVLFKLLGHEAKAVSQGREALAATAEFDPDLVVLDIGLPDLSGYEIVRAIKRDPGRKRYVAAATGWGSDRDRARARDAGFDHHVTKPLNLQIVRQLLSLAERDLEPA